MYLQSVSQSVAGKALMMFTKIWIFHLTLILLTLKCNFYTFGNPVASFSGLTDYRLLQNSINHPVLIVPCTAKDDSLTELPNTDNGIIHATRNGVKNTRLRWKRFYVYLDPKFDKWERDLINQSLSHLSDIIPCVKFGIYPTFTRPRGDYVRVVKGKNNGCNSLIGKQGGRQTINLQSPGCIYPGTVKHELLHALGFHHEHSRYDRDDFIKIDWENIQPKYKSSFQKVSASITTTYGVPYNYNSIMHYDALAFSRNGKPTIIAKNGQALDYTGELQQTDIEKLKAMYKC